ncbi:cell division protein FtsB [Candidatus Nitromaritima sp. SCGC AAA799-C22]|nr:cell division protein FtsB [Candidatus Nitromaritima sp. SCGC AAA799-C22]
MKKLSLYQQIILLSITFFLLLMIVAVFHEDGILTVYDFDQELIEFKASNEALRNENELLRVEIDALKSDPFAIELLAREKLNLVRPGETVYQLVPQGSQDIPSG